MIQTEITTAILWYWELNDAQVQQAREMYATEEDAAVQQYVQAWQMLLPLEVFTKIKSEKWHACTHLTNTSSLFIRISDCGTEATIGHAY